MLASPFLLFSQSNHSRIFDVFYIKVWLMLLIFYASYDWHTYIIFSFYLNYVRYGSSWVFLKIYFNVFARCFVKMIYFHLSFWNNGVKLLRRLIRTTEWKYDVIQIHVHRYWDIYSISKIKVPAPNNPKRMVFLIIRFLRRTAFSTSIPWSVHVRLIFQLFQ